MARRPPAALPSAAMRTLSSGSSARLDPVRRLPLPRRGPLLRLSVVALLLVTAATLAYGADTAPDTEPAGGADPTSTGSETTSTSRPGLAVPGGPPAASAGHPGERERLPLPPELVGVAVPLGEPTALTVLRPGDRVDLFSVPAAGGDPVPHAEGALVLAADAAAATLFVALTPEQAHEVVAVPASARFAVIVRP